MIDIWLAEKYSELLTPASAWDSTSAHVFTVPAGKRWFLLNVTVNRNASGTLFVFINNRASAAIMLLGYEGAGTGWTTYPEGVNDQHWNGSMMVLDEGEEIDLAFGAAQGAGAVIGLSVLEVDI